MSVKSKEKVKKNKKVKVSESKSPCLCGCGKPATGNRFSAGHSSKLKSGLQKAFRNGGLNKEQKKTVAMLGWERFMPTREGVKLPSATGGLTSPQVNVLRVLAKAPGGLSRVQIVQESGIGGNHQDVIGATDPDGAKKKAKAEEKTGKKSLLTRKYVTCKMGQHNERSVMVWSITASGRKALEKALKG